MTVFAFPYAGGPARAFDGLARALPSGLCLQAAELPGHGMRIGEAPLRSMSSLAGSAAAAIRQTSCSDFVLLGQSFGGSVAFATAQTLARAGGPLPRAIVLCASNAPSWSMLHKGVPGLGCGSTVPAGPGRYPDDPQLRDMFERTFRPIIKADLAMLSEFVADNGEPPIVLDMELIVASGSSDALAPRCGAAAWQHHTTMPLHRIDVDGDHFFVQHAPSVLAARLATILIT